MIKCNNGTTKTEKMSFVADITLQKTYWVCIMNNVKHEGRNFTYTVNYYGF